jgi:hypothetical protein
MRAILSDLAALAVTIIFVASVGFWTGVWAGV